MKEIATDTQVNVRILDNKVKGFMIEHVKSGHILFEHANHRAWLTTVGEPDNDTAKKVCHEKCDELVEEHRVVEK